MNLPGAAQCGLLCAGLRRYRTALAWLAASLLAMACAPFPGGPREPRVALPPPVLEVTPPAPQVAATPPAPVVAETPRASAAPSAVAPRLLTLEDYKREVARRIYAASAPLLYQGAPPPLLKSVVVLTITVDADGQPAHVAVRRSNGYQALERVALQSVRDAAPLPRPGDVASLRAPVEFIETWLFRDDGRFQIRSLAEAQADD